MTDRVKIIKSNRKTLSIQIIRTGELVVRAPYGVPEREIVRFLREKEGWIQKRQREVLAQEKVMKEVGILSPQEIRALAEQALQMIPGRVAFYAEKIGVTYGRITIRNQKTRWGSCSSKGNLNFNCLLMLTPPEVIDSVVVHELCHRKEMNHSTRFYQEVYRVFPDYDKWDHWLKENGPLLMRRMTG